MAYNFPDNPSIGQVFQRFKWDGEKWVTNTLTGSGMALCYFSDTPPASPADGCLWFETDSGVLFVYLNDGNSKQWVSATPPQDTSSLLKRTGDTMSGPLLLAAAPTGNLEAATKKYVDDAIATIGVGSTPWQQDLNGDAIIRFSGNIMIRIKPSGLILTKDDLEVFSVSV